MLQQSEDRSAQFLTVRRRLEAAAATHASQLAAAQSKWESSQTQRRAQEAELEAARAAVAAASESRPQCCVCMDALPSVLLLPCKHLALCGACSADLERRGDCACPVCRSQVQQRCEGVRLS